MSTSDDIILTGHRPVSTIPHEIITPNPRNCGIHSKPASNAWRNVAQQARGALFIRHDDAHSIAAVRA
jgi:hypothetical protein